MPIMTIPFSARKAGPYMASAGQTVFGFSFPVLAAGDLTVWRDRGGDLAQLLLNVHYTVAGVGEQNGGSITLTSGAEDGDIVAIDGSLSQERATSFIGGVPFKTAFIDSDLNRLAIMVQELAREVGRAIRRGAVDESAGSLMLPQSSQPLFLGLDATGKLVGISALDALGSNVIIDENDNLSGVVNLSQSGYHDLTEIADPLSPTANVARLFARDRGGRTQLAMKDATGTIIDLFRGIVSVKDFGAVGDGTTEDQPAFQAAVDWSESLGGGQIHIPTGKYKLSSDVTITGIPITFHGDGPELSEILSYSNAAIVFNGGTPAEYDNNTFVLRNVGVRVNGIHTAAPIDINFTGGTGGTSVSAIIENVEITGDAVGSGFTTAIDLFNVRNALIRKVRILGDRDGTPISSQHGIKIAGDSDPVEIFIDQCTIYFVRVMVDISGTAEGIYITQSALVAGSVGISWNATGAQPLLSVIGCHINTGEAGINLVDVVQYQICNNLIYGENNGGHAVSSYIGIQADLNAVVNAHGVISGNDLQGIISGTKNGIAILSGAGTETILIDGNIINGFNTGILLQSSTSGVIVTDTNIFTSNGANVSNSGTGNVVAGSVKSSAAGQKVSNDGLIEKWATAIVTLNASGDGSVNFGTAFPNAFLWGSVCNGDPAASGAAVFSINQASSNASALAFSVRPNPGAVNVRVNWSAKGH